MTLEQLRQRVLSMLALANVGGVRIDPDTIATLINQGYKEVAAATDCLVRTATIGADAGTGGIYDLPADMHKIRNITVDPSSTPLLPITILDLDMSNPRWRTEAAGTPTKMAYYSHTQFVVTPAPGNGVGPLNVEGYIVPSSEVGGVALLANANDEPEFGPQFHTILAYFAVRELAGYDLLSDNPAFQAKAQECDGKYNSMIAAMMDYYATGVGVQARKPMGG